MNELPDQGLAPAPGPWPPAPAPPPAADPPWGFRDLARLLLVALTALLFSQMAGTVIYTQVRDRLGWSPGVVRMSDDVRFILPVQLAAYVFTVGFVYAMVSWKYRRRFWEAVHWQPVGERGPLFFLAGMGLAISSQLVPYLFPTDRPLPIEKLFNSPMAGYLLALFGILVAPFVEELLFRGVIYPVFERQWGLGTAVVSTAALFAGIHVPQLDGGWPQVTAIFCVGLALSYARGRTGSLVPPFLMHLSYNSTLFASLYLSTNRFRNWPLS